MLNPNPRARSCPFTEHESPLLSHTSAASTAGATPTIGSAAGTARRTVVLRAAYQGVDGSGNEARKLIKIDYSQPSCIRKYLAYELDVSRLNRIHKHLWFAGLPTCARQLSRQRSIDRKILVTERADLHLLWRDDRLLIKPLPDVLLDSRIWQDYLCQDASLYEDASGFLLSYMWLVCQRSDLQIAHEEHLIPPDITWDQWAVFSKAVLSRLDSDNLSNINPRYIYGELRLTRLNLVCRLSYFSPRCLSGSFLTGYEHGYYTQYSTFLKRSFSWILVVFVYITIVLTAMQVGLGTNQLHDNTGFNTASYGFTIFSIVMPLFAIILASGVLGCVAFLNISYNLKRHHRARAHFVELFNHPRLNHNTALRRAVD